MKHILLVEDDDKLLEHLSTILVQSDYHVSKATSKESLVTALSLGEQYNIIILDRLLLDFDTKTILPQIKALFPESLILILSAINTPNERIEALNLGADDYLGKPFSTQEVLARVNALSRRVKTDQTTIGNTILHEQSQSISTNDKAEPLTQKEYQLIKKLTQPLNRVWSRSDLLKEVWDIKAEIDTNVVEMTIAKLRKKLSNINSNLKIRNSRHAGYWIET
ncbi:MAG: Transcriptional regulatory protein CreB [Holosporales bacterium]